MASSKEMSSAMDTADSIQRRVLESLVTGKRDPIFDEPLCGPGSSVRPQSGAHHPPTPSSPAGTLPSSEQASVQGRVRLFAPNPRESKITPILAQLHEKTIDRLYRSGPSSSPSCIERR